MPVLELPGGGITTPKYDRVVASSLEELLAFTPEVLHVWGLVRGQFTRRYWDGVEWKVAGVIGSGPLASAPAASANDGLYYYDNVTGNLYQSVNGEWVGVNAWLMDGSEYITVNGENINVDDPNLQLLSANGFVLGSNGFILGV